MVFLLHHKKLAQAKADILHEKYNDAIKNIRDHLAETAKITLISQHCVPLIFYRERLNEALGILQGKAQADMFSSVELSKEDRVAAQKKIQSARDKLEELHRKSEFELRRLT